MPTRLVWLAVKFVLSAAIFIVIVRHVEFSSVTSRAMAVGLGTFIVATFLAFFQIVLAAIRWREIVRVIRTPDEPLPPVIGVQIITFGAQVIGQVLPFIAGDAMRALLLTRNGVGLGTAIKSTAFDRGIGGFALSGLVPIALLMSPTAREVILPHSAAIVALGALGAAVALLLVGSFLFHRGAFEVRRRDKGGRFISQVWRDVLRLIRSAPGNARIVGTALAIHLLGVSIFALYAVSLSLGDHLADILALTPLILLASMMPFAFGGWGIREGFALLVLQRVGVDAASAVALSITFGVTSFVAALPGVVAFLLLPEREVSGLKVQRLQDDGHRV